MTKFCITLLALAALVGLARADDFLANGGFEQGLETGWSDSVYSLAGTSFFECTDSLGQPTPGFAARVRKDLASFAMLQQTVTVPGVGLVFSFDGRFRIGGGSSTCWPVATVILRYLNAADVELGNTKFILHNEFCTWGNNDTAHLIEITTPEQWGHYDLNITQEITEKLPGVNAADVARVRVEIYAYDNGT